MKQKKSFVFFTSMFDMVFKGLYAAGDANSYILQLYLVLSSATMLAKNCIRSGQPLSEESALVIDRVLKSFLGCGGGRESL